MTASDLMDKAKKPSRTNLVEKIPSKNLSFKKESSKKVVQISEDSPVFLEPPNSPDARKSRPKSADVNTTPSKPRSRSLQGQRPRSAQVSSGNSVTTSSLDQGRDRRDLIASFNRSLRLLGLQVEEIHTDNTPRRPSRVEGPSFSTRLHSRTVSLESVRASALHCRGLEDRRAVASAVYQEWYFTKLGQERAKRQQQTTQRKMQATQLEQRKRELKSKAEENFLEWRQRKQRETTEACSRQRERDAEMATLRADATKIQKALADWNNTKAQQLHKETKARREKEAKEADKKARSEQEKQQHAREAYAAWQKKATQSLQTQAAREQRQKEAGENQKSKRQQRHKEAQECFAAWKQFTDEQIKSKIKQTRLSSERSASIRGERLAERVYEAEQAYHDWLDSLDNRTSTSRRQPRSNSVSPCQLLPWN